MRKPKIGDLVVLRRDGRYVKAKIIAIRRGGFWGTTYYMIEHLDIRINGSSIEDYVMLNEFVR